MLMFGIVLQDNDFNKQSVSSKRLHKLSVY